ILSGHGCFRSYLKLFGHDETDERFSCGRDLVEDANHILFECGRFLKERRCMEEALGRSIRAVNMVNVEDANHVLFKCGRFLEERRCLEEHWAAPLERSTGST
ncbi:hypothetical protein AWZ03_015459, partial [Drosophila navojoa]